MERLIGVVGIAAILGLAWLWSYNRRAVVFKPVLVGLVLQVLLAVAVLKVPLVQGGFQRFADGATRLVQLSSEGAGFLFSSSAGKGTAPVVGAGGAPSGIALLGEVLFVRILPPIIFFSALTSLFYYLGLLQRIVQTFAFVMTKLMGVSGAESLSAATNTVLGMTEAPLIVRPHVPTLTDSELFAVMVGGFATSAGGVLALYVSFDVPAKFVLAASLMAAPGSLVLAKLMCPENGTPLTAGSVRTHYERTDRNAIEALASGTSTGLQLALNVAAMLISFIAAIALVNVLLGAAWEGLTLQRILGWVFWPIAFLLGAPAGEAGILAQLLGTKFAVNEVVAYGGLKELIAAGGLSERTVAIASFALCGFANLGSIGIQIGGLGVLAPDRRKDLARFGFRAMCAGSMVAWLNGALAGILL
jgi:concentrative nucleoside transporter, CNT family